MISNYGELRAAVASYTHRADFVDGGVNAARVPEFIALAEKRINRTLAKVGGGEVANTTDLVTVASQVHVLMPQDFNAMRYLAVLSGGRVYEMKYRTPEVMYREINSDALGMPRLFTLHGGGVAPATEGMVARMRPIPDAAYPLLAYYYKKVSTLIGAVGGDTATNWMLSNNPDVYIFGACLEAAGWIRDDAMLSSFATGFARAVEDITENDDDQRVANASPRANPNFRMIKGM